MLKNSDPKLYNLIQKENNRQINSIELIASENYTSNSIIECLGSCLTNKYSEGYVGRRYYGGNEVIDEIESLCIKRALKAFHVEKICEYVNISLNKNSIYGDVSAFNPSGIRIGSPWMTTRSARPSCVVRP